MDDKAVPLARLIASCLWAATATLVVLAWFLNYYADWREAQLVGYTACALSAVAAVSHIRCYIIRVCRLLRSVGGLEDAAPEGGPHLRTLR